jgi:hypothetical protein
MKKISMIKSWFLGIFIILLLLILNPLTSWGNQDEQVYTYSEEQHFHRKYFNNAIIPPFFGEDVVNRVLVYGDYVPCYLSQSESFNPYPTSGTPPYKNIFGTAQEVINAAKDSNNPYHVIAVNCLDFAESMLAMEQKEIAIKNSLSQQTIETAIYQLSNFAYNWEGLPPSSIWFYNPNDSLQAPYQPEILMSEDATFIAPVNQWNHITYNPAENYVEAFDELLHPVPDMSFLDGIYNNHGPMWELGTAMADIANPYTILPALFLMGFDLYNQSQQKIDFLYPTTTGHEFSVFPESGMIMIKNNDRQMVYTITGGEGGSFTNIPSGDSGILFVYAVNAFGGSFRPKVSLTDSDLVQGNQVKYNQVPEEYQDRDYSLNLESHVGVSQNEKWLHDTVVCQIQGEGRLIMIPFKIGCRVVGKVDQVGDIISKTEVGIHFKDNEKIYTCPLADCLLENIAGTQDDILMWSGIAIFDALEYGQEEIEEIYLTVQSGAIKRSGLDKFHCYTSLSFSPYFLKPIVTLPHNIETFPGEIVTFQTEILEQMPNATVDVSWNVFDSENILQGETVTYNFDQPGLYQVEMIIDPQFQPLPPLVEIENKDQLFWNTETGKMIWPFTVKVLSPVELEVGWQLPPCFPLNTSNYPGQMYFPNRSSQMKFWVTNNGSMDYDSQSNETLPPLEIKFFIDRNDNLGFSEDELVWSQELESINSQASSFFNVEEFFSMDRMEGIEEREAVIYSSGEHLCQCQVTTLSQEMDQENNSIQQKMEFVISPELATPDFSIENAQFDIDAYRNLDLNFFLKENCQDISIVEKWKSFYPEDIESIPQWGPVNYEVWIKNGKGYEKILSSGEIESVHYQENKEVDITNLNLYYVPSGNYSLEVNVNRGENPVESNWENNYVFLNRFTLASDSGKPWYTRGGDSSRSYWKNSSLIPPLITDWTVETSGVPVALVCNEEDFFVLTTEGKLEKYHADGVKQYSLDGFDGHLIGFASLMLVYPGSVNEKILIFSDDNHLKLLNTQDGNLLWTSQEEFSPKNYGFNSKNSSLHCHCLDYNGQYLLAAWPLTLYRFNESMNVPELLWQQEEKGNKGEVFLLGQQILAGQRIYSLEGEEIDRLHWMQGNALRFQDFIYSDEKRINIRSGQVEEIEGLKNLMAQFGNRILAGNPLQCFDSEGNILWSSHKEVSMNNDQESICRFSDSFLIWNTKPPVILGDQNQGYAYFINHNHQLLAVDLEDGKPFWYREFATPHDEAKENMDDNIDICDIYETQTYLSSPQIAAKISDIIPFQNSLLVGTFNHKIYRLSSTPVDHLVVRGTIPPEIYRLSILKVSIKAEDENGSEVPLEDKLFVLTDADSSSNRVFDQLQQIGETIGLPLTISNEEKAFVKYPMEPYKVSKQFQFADVQMFSNPLSVSLEIDNILSIIEISKKDAEVEKITSIALDSEAELSYKPRREKNGISLSYNGYGIEDVDQLIYPHGYRIGVSRRSNADIPNILEWIDFMVYLPESIQDTSQIKIKVNEHIIEQEPEIFWIEGNTLHINCLKFYEKEEHSGLRIYVLKE